MTRDNASEGIPTLWAEVTVHCFFQRCCHVVAGWDADEVHDEMENHYARDHRALIGRIVGEVGFDA